MSSRRLTQDIRTYMRDNPGTKFQQARDILTSEQEEHITELLTSLGVTDLGTFDPLFAWEANEFTPSLYIPLGREITGKDETDNVIGIDFADISHGGTGPHGILQARTGAGKSHTLNNIVLSLCMTYSPNKVNFVLADFMGFATFYGWDALPHVSVNLAGLGDDMYRWERLSKILDNEMLRRKNVLKTYRVQNIAEYTVLRESSPDIEPLPHLFVVMDEFQEFALDKNSITSTITRLAAQGRDLGIRLLLSMQSADHSSIAAVRNNLTYGISLAVSSAHASRYVLDGDPRAAKFPLGKGHAAINRVAPDREHPHIDEFRVFVHDHKQGTPTPRSVLDKMLNSNVRARDLWGTALDVPKSFKDINDEERQVHAAKSEWVIGFRDCTDDVTSPLLTVPARGDTAIIGAKNTGKTTALLAMVAASAMVPSVKSSWFVLDTERDAAPSKEFPNVVSYTCLRDTSSAKETVNRVVGEVTRIIKERSSDPQSDKYGDIYVAVDGIDALDTESAGTLYGISELHARHVYLVSISQSLSLRNGNKFDNVIHFNSNSPSPYAQSSSVLRKVQNLPSSQPGRCVVEDDSLIAVPCDTAVDDKPHRIGKGHEVYEYPDRSQDIAALGRSLSKGVKRVRVDISDVGTVPYKAISSMKTDGLPLGVNAYTAEHVALPSSVQHVAMLGDKDKNTHKIASMCTLVESVRNRYSSDEARFVILDYDLQMVGLAQYLINAGYMKEDNYCTNYDESTESLDKIHKLINHRIPTRSTVLSQGKPVNGKWYTGFEVYLVVCNESLDLATSSSTFRKIVGELRRRDLGVHVLLVGGHPHGPDAIDAKVVLRELEPKTATLLFGGYLTGGSYTSRDIPLEAMLPGRAKLVLPEDNEVRVVQVATPPDVCLGF